MSGGGTRSGRRSSNRSAKADTPSGVSYDQFMKMPLNNRYDVMDRIAADKNIKVPDYLDDSITSKVMYALGMTGKPEVVSEAEFDKQAGEAIYRTVNDSDDGKMSARDIIKQIKASDFTQLSNSGGSAYGRAVCFAGHYGDSAEYINFNGNNRETIMMRAKIKPNAKIFSYDEVNFNALGKEIKRMKKVFPDYSPDKWGASTHDDAVPIYAIAHGYSGWYKTVGISNYFMMLDRSQLVTSPAAKVVKGKNVNNISDFMASAPMSWEENSDTIQI